MLHAQDIVVFAKLAVSSGEQSNAELAHDLGLAASQIHAAIKRGEESRVLRLRGRRPSGAGRLKKIVDRSALYELLAFGVPYVFPARHGPVVRGMLAAGSAPVMREHLAGDVEPAVWPDPEGDARGAEIEPLHPNVPQAAKKDPKLYDVLALVDAIRVGRSREKKIAREELRRRIMEPDAK